MIDVSNPAAPRLLGAVAPYPPPTGGSPDSQLSIAIEADVVYLAETAGYVATIDVSNPYAPSLITFTRFPRASLTNRGDVEVQDGVLYVPSHPDLLIFDVANPAFPVQIAAVPVFGVTAIELSGDTAHVSTVAGLQLLDISDPAHPAELGILAYHREHRGIGLVVAGETAHLMTQPVFQVVSILPGLQAIDVSIPELPDQNYSIGDIYRSFATTATLLIAGGNAGIEVFDRRDPMKPARIGSAPLPAAPEALRVLGDTLYAGYYGGVAVFDVSTPALPRLVTTLPGRVSALAQADGALYVAIGDFSTPARVEVYDVAIPTARVPIGSPVLGGTSFPDLEVYGSVLCAATSSTTSRSLLTIDVSDPSAPRELDRVALPYSALALAVAAPGSSSARRWACASSTRPTPPPCARREPSPPTKPPPTSRSRAAA